MSLEKIRKFIADYKYSTGLVFVISTGVVVHAGVLKYDNPTRKTDFRLRQEERNGSAIIDIVDFLDLVDELEAEERDFSPVEGESGDGQKDGVADAGAEETPAVAENQTPEPSKTVSVPRLPAGYIAPGLIAPYPATYKKDKQGRLVCEKKDDKPGASGQGKPIHIDMECCLDPDEIPNPYCYYPREKYGKLLDRYYGRMKDRYIEKAIKALKK